MGHGDCVRARKRIPGTFLSRARKGQATLSRDSASWLQCFSEKPISVTHKVKSRTKEVGNSSGLRILLAKKKEYEVDT